MEYVNTHETKTNLSKLLKKVSQGEEIIIANAGVPIAKIIPYQESGTRKPGLYKGKVTKAFFEPLSEDELKSWE